MRTALGLLAALVLTTGCHGQATHGSSTSAKMSEVAVVIPIAPGKTQAWQDALADLVGPRYAEYESSRRRFGLTSQTTFLQRTPMGDLALIHMTGPDVHASFHAMSQSQEPWDVAWRKMTLDLHGVDFAEGDRVFPQVTPAWSMQAGDLSGTVQLLFAAPLTKEALETFPALTREIMGARNADYVRARTRIGVRREAVFVESTSVGNAVVFAWQAADPVASLHALAASTEPFDVWLREKAQVAHPVPLEMLTDIAAENRLIARYPRRP
jgi:hypothetical protein